MARYGARELAVEVGEATGLGAKAAGKLWHAVGRLADGTTDAGRGLSIPGLGRWTFLTNSTREKGASNGLDAGELATHSFKSRVFAADARFLRAHGLVDRAPPPKALLAPSTNLNLVAVARGSGLDKEAARSCLASALRAIGAAAANGKKLRLELGTLGELRADARVVRFAFRENRGSNPTWFSRDHAPLMAPAPVTARETPVSAPVVSARAFEESATIFPTTARQQTARCCASSIPTARVSEFGDVAAYGAPRSTRPAPSRDVLGVMDALMAPLGRTMVTASRLPAKTARTSNLKKQYARYDADLTLARLGNAYDDDEIRRYRDDDRRREAARRAAHHAARLENATYLEIQADADRARRVADKELRRGSWTLDDAARAFPVAAPLDHLGERRTMLSYAAQLGRQARTRADVAAAARVAERAADSGALARSLELHARDRAARHELHVAQQKDLASDWRRQKDYRAEQGGVTRLGALVRGQ